MLRILELDKFFFDLLNDGRYQWATRALIGKTPDEFDNITLNKIISGKISVRNLEINKNTRNSKEPNLIHEEKHLVIQWI